MVVAKGSAQAISQIAGAYVLRPLSLEVRSIEGRAPSRGSSDPLLELCMPSQGGPLNGSSTGASTYRSIGDSSLFSPMPTDIFYSLVMVHRLFVVSSISECQLLSSRSGPCIADEANT